MSMNSKAATGAAVGAVATLALVAGGALAAESGHVKNIVLVHGAWADGSGFTGIYKILVKDGYTVSIASNSDEGLVADIAATQRLLDRQDGPTILVGHSYGGTIITEAGMDPKVVGLVYLSAFAPDVGETTFGQLPKDASPPPFEVSKDGLAYLNRGAYLAAMAPDLPREQAEFMADSQIPLAIQAAGLAPVTQAAWLTKPSWFMVSTEDQIISPDLQRSMAQRAHSTIVEVKGSHLAFISHPDLAAKLIEQAAQAALD